MQQEKSDQSFLECLENEFQNAKDLITQIKNSRNENFLHMKERVDQFESKIKKYLKETEELSHGNINDHPSIIELTKEIEELAIVFQKTAEEKSKEEKNIHDKENCNKKLFQDIQTKEQVVERKSKKLMKGLQYFEENLGLNIKRFPDSHLKFTFTCIDELNIDREFSFHLTVVDVEHPNGDTVGIYEVSDCNPPLTKLKSIVEELNLSNDLRQFLCTVRREFKASIIT